MVKQVGDIFHRSCWSDFMPPCHELVAWQPYFKTVLLRYQKDNPQEPSQPHECNHTRQKTQHQGSIHGTNNTLVLPSPSSTSFYCSSQPKLNPQACAPLRGFFLYLTDGPAGVDVPWHTPYCSTKAGSKLWHISCIPPRPLVHKSTQKQSGCTGEWMTTQKNENPRRTQTRGVRT